jgi:molybdopterin-guanine dinucleotide biosynthesis protein A
MLRGLLRIETQPVARRRESTLLCRNHPVYNLIAAATRTFQNCPYQNQGNAPTAHNLTIGVLTGGASRRMGRPKALIRVEGVSILQRTVALAATLTDRVVLLGRPPFGLPEPLSSQQIIEDLHPGVGPLGGLEALMLQRPDDACILLACDMPRLNPELLRRLAHSAGDADAAVCRTLEPELQWHPCCALYRPAARPRVESAIGAQRYSMHGLLNTLRLEPIELVGEEAAWVQNWNVPDDIPG